MDDEAATRPGFDLDPEARGGIFSTFAIFNVEVLEIECRLLEDHQSDRSRVCDEEVGQNDVNHLRMDNYEINDVKKMFKTNHMSIINIIINSLYILCINTISVGMWQYWNTILWLVV